MRNYLRMAMSEGFLFEDLRYAGYPENPSIDKAVGATKDAFSKLFSEKLPIQKKIDCDIADSATGKQVYLWQWVTTANTK